MAYMYINPVLGVFVTSFKKNVKFCKDEICYIIEERGRSEEEIKSII